MDRKTSIDPFGKTREAPASGSFSILRRSVTAPVSATGQQIDRPAPLVALGDADQRPDLALAAGGSILYQKRQFVVFAGRFGASEWAAGL